MSLGPCLFVGGMYILNPSSSDDEKGPSGLHDDRIVEAEPIWNFPRVAFGMEKRRDTGQILPTRFIPPMNPVLPTELYLGMRTVGNLSRYTHRYNSKAFLVFTDGACLNNGQSNPKAGWALVHGLALTGEPLIASDRLENKGPFGDNSIQSSNRAELRAVIAALRFRHWPIEGFSTMTIATDSEYVVQGSTKWARAWIKNGWKTRGEADVKNKDLWKVLLTEVERSHYYGLSVNFWRIPREWNQTADAAAKKAASENRVNHEWVDTRAMPVGIEPYLRFEN